MTGLTDSTELLSPAASDWLAAPKRMLVGGEWAQAADGRTFATEDPATGRTVAEVPQGAFVSIMEGDAQSVLDATDAACADSLAALEGHPPLGLIAFDCVARRGVLGAGGTRAEIDRLNDVVETGRAGREQMHR